MNFSLASVKWSQNVLLIQQTFIQCFLRVCTVLSAFVFVGPHPMDPGQ